MRMILTVSSSYHGKQYVQVNQEEGWVLRNYRSVEEVLRAGIPQGLVL